MRSTGRDLLVALAAVVAFAALLVHRPSAHAPLIRASGTMTPGALNPDVTQATIHSTICVQGWTKTIRPPVEYTNELKLQQMRQYAESGSSSQYQEDHLISLELARRAIPGISGLSRTPERPRSTASRTSSTPRSARASCRWRRLSARSRSSSTPMAEPVTRKGIPMPRRWASGI